MQSSAAENGLGILPMKHVPGRLTATRSCDPSSVWLWLPRTGRTMGAPMNAEAGGLRCRLAGSGGKFGVLSRSAVGCTQNMKPCELSFGFSAVRPGLHSTHSITELLNQKLPVALERGSHSLPRAEFPLRVRGQAAQVPGLSRQQEALQTHAGLSAGSAQPSGSCGQLRFLGSFTFYLFFEMKSKPGLPLMVSVSPLQEQWALDVTGSELWFNVILKAGHL